MTRAKRDHARPHSSLIEAVTHWPERGALVGLDLGTKTIGVAVVRSRPPAGDRRRDASSARPSRPMRRGCWRIAAERNAVGFVLGLPINMDGSEGPRAQSTRAFARNLSNLTGLCHRAVGRAALAPRRSSAN